MTHIIITKYGKGKLRDAEVGKLLRDILSSDYEVEIIEDFRYPEARKI